MEPSKRGIEFFVGCDEHLAMLGVDPAEEAFSAALI